MGDKIETKSKGNKDKTIDINELYKYHFECHWSKCTNKDRDCQSESSNRLNYMMSTRDFI